MERVTIDAAKATAEENLSTGRTMSLGRRRFIKVLLASLACWLSLAPVLGLQWWANALPMSDHPSFTTMVGLAFSTYLAFALLTPVLFAIVLLWPIQKPHVILRVLLYAVGTVLFILVVEAVRVIVLPPWDVGAQHFMPRAFSTYWALVTSRFADCTTAYLMILVAAHALSLHDRTRRQQVEQSDLRRDLAESELQTLKTQLHPHFLFNTLQGISALTEENPALAKRMIVALGDLLRAALKHSSVDLIPLGTEMQFVNAYLELEGMRLGDRLKLDMNISRRARECLVPQMILQPLVENAIVHGVANSRVGGWVEISSEVNDEKLRLRITNSVSARAVRGTGVGLRNTRARLEHLFPGDASLMFRLIEPEVAECLVVLPVLRGSSACTAS